MASDRGAHLCHLHEREDALLHARAAGCGKRDHGKVIFRRVLKCTADFFADRRAHACHDEARLHRDYDAALAADLRLAGYHRFIFARLILRPFELVPVSREVERVA